MSSSDLFPGSEPREDETDVHAPLAERLRPRSLDEIVGQEHLTGPDKLFSRILSGDTFPSLILWGPPGTGKTTLARLLAGGRKASFVPMSAVSVGVKDIRAVVTQARLRNDRRTVLFLDEIHRFNKAQQDALLPHVESGLLILIGATTENPSFEVNSALLSRCRVLVLRSLTREALAQVFDHAMAESTHGFGDTPADLQEGFKESLVAAADGDARRLLNALEVAMEIARADVKEGGRLTLTLEHAREALQARTLRHDKSGEEHFNIISALHKSVRASDPQGAVYWTERMLSAGEDPLYVARRLIRMAVEDIGLADPQALPQTVSAQQAVHFLGMPEGGVALAQAALYLALAPKSNRVYVAERKAQGIIEETGSLPVPLAFRNPVTGLMKNLGYGEKYRYDHDDEDGVSGQECLPEEIEGLRFYEPTDRGFEKDLHDRMEEIRRKKSGDQDESTHHAG